MNIKKIRPMFDAIVCTMDKYEEDTFQNGLVQQQKGTLKEYQTVIAVGNMVRDVSVGDLVCINPKNYAVRKYEDGSMKDGIISENTVIRYQFNTITMDNKDYLLLNTRDISYVVEEWEEEFKSPDIIIPDNKIITN